MHLTEKSTETQKTWSLGVPGCGHGRNGWASGPLGMSSPQGWVVDLKVHWRSGVTRIDLVRENQIPALLSHILAGKVTYLLEPQLPLWKRPHPWQEGWHNFTSGTHLPWRGSPPNESRQLFRSISCIAIFLLTGSSELLYWSHGFLWRVPRFLKELGKPT